MVTVYIICFWVGLLLTLALAVMGPFGHSHHWSLEVFHHAAVPQDVHSGAPSPFNLTTLLSFLTVFGGIGYILSKEGLFSGALILVLSVCIGCVVAGVLFLVLAKVFYRGELVMREEDYNLSGILGYVSIPIPESGVGEIKFVLAETTRSMGARSVSGQALAKREEVVILSVDRGIAVVIGYEEHVHGVSRFT